MEDVKAQIRQYDFEEFKLKNQFAKEDEANAQADVERQNGWYEDAKAEAEELKEARDALKSEDGTIPAGDQAEYDRLDGELTAAANERDRLKGDVEGLQADQ